jgi:hypothetical protein
MIERVMDLFAGKRAEVRGEYDERALAVAQYLYNLAQEAEQAEMDRALQKLMQGKELSFREKELAQQAILTREGYALQKYLASLKGGGGKVSTTPTPVPIPTPAPKPAPTPKDVYEKQKSDYYLQQYAQQGWTQYKKPATTKTYSYQEELATPRTYKGLGGVIY